MLRLEQIRKKGIDELDLYPETADKLKAVGISTIGQLIAALEPMEVDRHMRAPKLSSHPDFGPLRISRASLAVTWFLVKEMEQA